MYKIVRSNSQVRLPHTKKRGGVMMKSGEWQVAQTIADAGTG